MLTYVVPIFLMKKKLKLSVPSDDVSVLISVPDPWHFGIGSADPFLWLMDPDPDLDSDPDPAIFAIDLQDANK